jgi:hypothetical protein
MSDQRAYSRHLHTTWSMAQLAAQDYLEEFAGLLALKDTELRSLGLSTELTPTADGVEYRLWAEIGSTDEVEPVPDNQRSINRSCPRECGKAC